MEIKCEGFEELIELADNLGDVGKNIQIKSFKNALKPSEEILKKYAPEDSGKGKEKIKVSKVKKYKSGSIWGQLGINKDNWEYTKGIYFQNYGYDNWGLNGIFHGMHIDMHEGWFDKGFEAMAPSTFNNLENELLKEIDKILK